MIGFPVGISLDRQVLNPNLPLYQAKPAWSDFRIYIQAVFKKKCHVKKIGNVQLETLPKFNMEPENDTLE